MTGRALPAAALLAAALAACAIALTTAVASSGIARDSLQQDLDEWGPLPSELTVVLEAKAAQYAQRALGFTCIERLRRAEYERSDATSETIREHEYILIADPGVPGGLAGLRSKPGSGGSSEKRPDIDHPEPVLWSQLFDPAIRSTLKFKVGPLHTTPYKLAMPISWISSAPVFEGTRITEWSGTVEIEYRTGNLLSVTAQPNLQEERILAELGRYLTAFRILGFSAAPPPIGRELDVRFRYDNEGLTYPSRVDMRTFRQVSRDRRVTEQRQRTDYGEYRFFGIQTKEEIPPLLYVPGSSTEGGGG